MLAALIVVNIVCAAFFLADVVADFESLAAGEGRHLVVEAIASVGLMLGTGFLLTELRRLLQRNATMESGLRTARGEMIAVIEQFFLEWKLTDSERDVAFLVVKGLDNDEIATVRGTAAGTIRAQCAAVYRKAGVSGRAQLLSLFVDHLLGGAHLVAPRPGPQT